MGRIVTHALMPESGHLKPGQVERRLEEIERRAEALQEAARQSADAIVTHQYKRSERITLDRNRHSAFASECGKSVINHSGEVTTSRRNQKVVERAELIKIKGPGASWMVFALCRYELVVEQCSPDQPPRHIFDRTNKKVDITPLQVRRDLSLVGKNEGDAYIGCLRFQECDEIRCQDGCRIVRRSNSKSAMARGRDRRPELGWRTRSVAQSAGQASAVGRRRAASAPFLGRTRRGLGVGRRTTAGGASSEQTGQVG